MYHTPAGDRILMGAERRFFTASLGTIVDLFATDDDIDLGVAAFDELQRNQKLFSLYSSSRGLLRPDEPAPDLTAFIESAVATVYEFAADRVRNEIEDPEPKEGAPHWRSLILDAAGELDGDIDLPDVADADIDIWDLLLECLAGRVLWDNDYELRENLDLPPEEGKLLHATLGMDDDYFTAIAPDPPDDQVNLYLDALMGLTASAR